MERLVYSDAADDRDRFTKIYREFYPKVLAYFRRRTSAEAAPDLAAEVFTRAWRQRSKLWRATNSLAWLYAISRNVLLEFYRQRGHDHEALRALSVDNAHSPDTAGSVTDAMDLARALQSLKPKDREVLLLNAWEGLDGAELAEALGVSTGAARVRLHRARGRLAATMFDQEVRNDGVRSVK